MLTIEDIARRWGVTVRQARAVVASGGVPRIDLRPAPGRYISWRTTRFALADVEAWEEARKTAGASPAVAPPPAVKVKPRGPRPDVPNRLGRW